MNNIDGTDRRSFLRHSAMAAIPLLAGSGTFALAQDPQPGLILRETNPENLEYPFYTLKEPIVPNDRFFVRSHFPVPDLNTDTWRLKVEGAVDHPLNLSFAELLKMPSASHAILLECAGNGRVFLNPKVRGLQWELGGVGMAKWTGVPLLHILAQAGPSRNAVQVILEGADSGEVRDEPNRTPGKIHFARSMPIKKAMQPELLLAYKMNGSDLTKAHGYPLRAIVPGWYGVAAVKWLTRIIVVEQPFNGFYQSLDYSYFRPRDNSYTIVPVSELQVKAQIARPARGETVKLGESYRVYGAAWTGESEVRKVEVSGDGGKSWEQATLDREAPKYGWRMWEYRWKPAKAGRVTLMARATDARGHVQPMERDPARRTYMISHVLPVEVDVRA